MERRRQFLGKLCVAIIPVTLLPQKLRSQSSDQSARPPITPGPQPDEETSPFPPGSRKAALQENEKEIKAKVEKLFQLASELKDQVENTDSAKVLSLAMVKKAEEIEKLAKDIKTRAKG